MSHFKKKSTYRVQNWSEYNIALKRRGSLTVWLDEYFEGRWLFSCPEDMKKGRPLYYSDYSIEIMMSFRNLFYLPLRQVTGFVESLFELCSKELPVPNFSRLSRRSPRSLLNLTLSPLQKNSYIVIDSTGLKVFGEKEWLETKYGKQSQRKVWRKVHIGIDDQGHVVARSLTDHKTDDRTTVPDLLDQMKTSQQHEVLCDRGYDSYKTYDLLESKKIEPLIPPPRHAKVCNTISSKRNGTVEYIKKKGYWSWHYKHNFGRRNRVENTFYRLKTIFGRKLSSRVIQNQDAETHLICHLLNKMIDLGMPNSIKIA